MSTLTMRISITLCIIVLLAHQISSLPRPQTRNDAAVAEAIDYLHALESAYSQASRPRFGKRSSHGKLFSALNPTSDDEEDWAEYPFVH